MSDSQNQNSPANAGSPPGPAASDAPDQPAAPREPENKRPDEATEDHKPDSGRRRFFGQSLREVMAPLSLIIEKKVNPLLNALSQFPGQVETATNRNFPPLGNILGPTLDQPSKEGIDGSALSLPMLPESPARFLRPPGALQENDFATTCSRCGKCVEVCPAHAIKLDRSGAAGGGLPYIVPTEMPCVVCDSLACMNTCPSGALKLVAKLEIHMGLAKVDHTLCRRSSGEDCRICAEQCPLGTSAIAISAETGRVVVKRLGCIGCGICEQACPTEPRAIVVFPPEKKTEPIVA